MRALLSVLCCLVLVVSASAGQNPYVRAFVSMTPDSYVHSYPNAPAGIIDTYLCFDCLGTFIPGEEGLTGVSLVLDYQCGGFVAGSADVTVFHPGAQTVIGGPDDLVNGWVIAAPECVPIGPYGIIVAARVPWYYLGAPAGDILILPNPVDGKATVDCDNDIDFFCVLSHGAIGQDVQTPGDYDCDCGHSHITYVYCEPQGGDNPTHAETYWYDAYFHVCPAIEGPLYGFSVQVFDPDPDNYTNWVEPPEWTHMVHESDGATWVTWCTDNSNYMGHGLFRFEFQNPNPPAWGEWLVQNWGGRCSPSFSAGTTSSWDSNHDSRPDGYGRRVHVPIANSPAEDTSWGAIKALYR